MKSWGPRREPLPPLNALIALEATTRLGSFRAAADEMNVTQGAVAQQIRAVEEDLGIMLFDRHPRGLVARAEAARFLETVRQALSGLSTAITDLQEPRGDGKSQRVILSAPPSISSRWLIPRLPDFYTRHPDVSIAVDATSDVRPLLGPDRVDLAIRWGKAPETGWSRPMLSGPFIVVASPSLLGAAGHTDPAALLRHTLISDGYDAWRHWFEQFTGTVPEMASMTISLSTLAIDAAEKGIGVAISPEPLVRSALAEGRLVRALSPEFDLDTGHGFHLVASRQPKAGPVGKVSRWLLDEAARDL
ncbi:LysR family transcriptional regulator [Rhodobacteraceae bacterium NNCM2]|nr:LysR family transcriptional regulator [Coraliihabitans acroporae]